MRFGALGLALAALAAVASSLSVVDVDTSREVALALADPGVGDIVLRARLFTLMPADFDGLALPIQAGRNVTIRGPAPDLPWPILDLNFQRWKVQLLQGVTLEVRNVVITRLRDPREGNPNFAPGVPLIKPPPNGGSAVVAMRDSASIFAACAPLTVSVLNVTFLHRPAAFPGIQLREFTLPQEGCTDDPAAPAMQRCYALRNKDVDVVLQGADYVDLQTRVIAANNIAYMSINNTVLCQRIFDDSCWQRVGREGCWAYDPEIPVGRPLPTVAGGPSNGSAGGSTQTALVAALCGSVLGAAAVVVLVGAVLWARARRRRRQSGQRSHEPGSGDCEAISAVSLGPPATGSAPASATPAPAGCSAFTSSATAAQMCAAHGGPVTPFTPKRPDLRLGVRLAKTAGPASSSGGAQSSGASSLLESLTATNSTNGLGPGEGCNAVELLPTVRGCGAFGQVFEGTFQGQRVAVKVVSEAWAGGAEQPCATQLKCFGQEVQVLGRCDHPCIVRLLAASLQPPLCLVMELCDTSLDRVLYSRKGIVMLPLRKVLHIAIEIAKGLEYLHPTIVHRDLKPANVLLNNADSDTPGVKLTDFGLARLHLSVIHTRAPGAGTPAYLAPECYEASNVEAGVITHHADMYSYGILLWEMLAGRRPWEGRDHLEVARDVMGKRARPALDALRASRCPWRLEQLMAACWEHDPLRRPAAAEVVKHLESIRDEQDWAAVELEEARAGSLGAAPVTPTTAAKLLHAGGDWDSPAPRPSLPDLLSANLLSGGSTPRMGGHPPPGPITQAGTLGQGRSSDHAGSPSGLQAAEARSGTATTSAASAAEVAEGPDEGAAAAGEPARPQGRPAGNSLGNGIGATSFDVRHLASTAVRQAAAVVHVAAETEPAAQAPGPSAPHIRFAVQLLGPGAGPGGGGTSRAPSGGESMEPSPLVPGAPGAFAAAEMGVTTDAPVEASVLL
ncbi:hypothetical protein HYH03_017463 [Edaphochlamys debaryana]|uniref:Protein kinase domain-containing protein n=1 Tax=Edaphochlamys debaryana TaxID=47281 RepID=A0A835XHV0_9CHLO|nr:hypothetical protein HYH03_017463 [Edaphochlamys debaryana]|eukprot:KAG2483660.1 hypothetical protein HYH03_017463 [Edaphochlamys debaryana]